MAQLIEHKKINDRSLIFHFEFDQTKFAIGTGQQHFYTLDKWLSIENWDSIYQKLDEFSRNYVTTAELTTDKTFTIENSPIEMIVTWVKLNSTLKNFIGLRTMNSYKHFVNIKFKTMTKLEKLVKNLTDEINDLKRKNPQIGGSSKQMDGNETSDLIVSMNSSVDIFDDHEEYVPEKSSDSSIELTNATYKPMTSSSSRLHCKNNEEYTPKSTCRRSDEDDSFEKHTIYYPNGQAGNFQHEQYTPDPIVVSSASCSQSNLNKLDYKPNAPTTEEFNNTIEPDNPNGKTAKDKKRRKKPLEVDVNVESPLKRNTNKKTKYSDSDNLFGNDSETEINEQPPKDDGKPIEKERMRADLYRKAKPQKSLKEDDEDDDKRKPVKKNTGWLQKNTPTTRTPSKKKRRREKETEIATNTAIEPAEDVCLTLKNYSPEELAAFNQQHEEKMRELQKLKEQIKQLDPVLPNVEILTLKDMPAKEIIATYSDYQHQFKKIIKQYQNRTKAKFVSPSHLTSLLSGELLTNQQQLDIMSFLEDKFKMQDEISGLSELFWDIILPEWSLSVYMAKYNFTLQEAIDRIHLQEKLAINANDSQI